MRRESAGRLTAVLAVATLALVGCGSESPDAGNHANHDGSAPSDASSTPTPAAEVPGAELAEGEFAALKSAPPGSEKAAGKAVLARHDKGTTVTVELTGLTPAKKYMSHVHAKPCAEDGGGHFKFDQAGPETPPNEVHLTINADASGAATVTTENDRKVGPEAKSVVVHDGDAKMLCADL